MIVVLTGAHSCGKSTLVEFFKGKENFTCIDSVTRKSTTDKDRRIDGQVHLDEAQYAILENILEATNELIQMNKKDPSKVYLVDRCVFDFIAYTRAFYRRGLISLECLDRIEDTCNGLWESYDLICYLGIEFNIVDDGVRSLDEDLRKDVDQEILNQLLWNRVKAIKLNGSVRQRVEMLQYTIHTLQA